MQPSPDSRSDALTRLTRRAFLGRAAFGLGALPLRGLLDPPARGTSDHWSGVVSPLHFRPRARRVIWLGMMGGPSQLETLDYKPKLLALDGQPMPDSFTKGQPIAQLQGQALKILGPQHPFRRFGQSQQEISSVLPHIGSIADELCIIRSLQTERSTTIRPRPS